MTEVMSGVVTPQDKKKSPPRPPLLIKNAGPSQNLLLVSILFQWH